MYVRQNPDREKFWADIAGIQETIGWLLDPYQDMTSTCDAVNAL